MGMNKVLGYCILFLLFINCVFSVDISLVDYYALGSNLSRIDDLCSDNLLSIEYLVLNYSVFDSDGLSDWYFNFTADGLDGCARGNLQHTECYNYDNSDMRWIKFVDGEITSTFDGSQGVQGDRIVVNRTVHSVNNWSIMLTIDEHYNPNIIKSYGDGYNFSDIVYQTDYKITKNNYMFISADPGNIPFTVLPDVFKLDVRMSYTDLIPTQPLEIYACINYSVGDPEVLGSCDLLCLIDPSDFQDDGDKVRCIGDAGYLSALGSIPNDIILKSDEPNPNRYYYLKTYGVSNENYTPNWHYSINSGGSYSDFVNGYETDMNVNWFNDGADPTKFVGLLVINDSLGNFNYSENFVNWSIDPEKLYFPLLSISSPGVNEILSVDSDVNISWNVIDYNSDALNVSIFLDDGLVVSDLSENVSSYVMVDVGVGSHDLLLRAEKVDNSSFFVVYEGNFSVVENVVVLGAGSFSGFISDDGVVDESVTFVDDGVVVGFDLVLVFGVLIVWGTVIFGLFMNNLFNVDRRKIIRKRRLFWFIFVLLVLEILGLFLYYFLL